MRSIRGYFMQQRMGRVEASAMQRHDINFAVPALF
jgi:hypothetical protein